MSLLFETIKIANGNICNIEYHNARVNESRKQLLKQTDPWDLRNLIAIPKIDLHLTYKCKLIYSEKLQAVEFQKYTIRKLQTLKLVECPDIEYSFKYLDRTRLDTLKQTYHQTNDIIIVQNQQITECTYANIIFYDGEKWITPANPLLKGTKRQKYLDERLIFEDNIKISDLIKFTKARIINAMIDIHECPDILMKNIFF
jgi:4-amino-4-deoxychorismate lyase